MCVNHAQPAATEVPTSVTHRQPSEINSSIDVLVVGVVVGWAGGGACSQSTGLRH